MSVSDELEDRLSAAGKRLLQPPSSFDELLTLLDRIEELLLLVAQSPPTSMQSAMSPLLKALISEELLKHPDIDVRVGVAACISEITRITAPEAPYGDDEMKDVFQLIVSSFDNLSDKSSRSYKKRASILETVAKVRSCVIMLDLELDQMIIEMFQHFLNSIRVHHEDVIFTSMSAIMILVLEESEDISPEFLWPILDALKKNNKEVLPIVKKLAESVITNCADKLRPCLAKVVNTLNASLDDYNEVVASVCKKTNGSFGHSDENILKDQPAIEDVKEGIKPQEKAPAQNGTHKSIACNSIGETGDEETVTDVFPLMLNQQPKVAMFKLQFDAQSTTKTESDDIGPQKPAHLEVKSEHAANGEARPANCRNNSAESSDIIDDEKQGEQVPCNQEIPSEEIHTLPGEFPPAEAEKPLDTVKDTTSQGSPVKETEDEAANVASPIQRSSLPDENQPKRAARTKRKKNMVKEDTASRKESEGPNIGEVNKKRRTMKKQHNLPNNVEKASNEDLSKNDAGAMSDLEARCLDSGELGGASNKKKKKSLMKEDGRRGGRVKPKFEEETSKYSAGDNGNNTDASLSPAKSAEDELNQEETPRTDSKRKRASGKDNTPQTIKYGKNLVGSKVRVLWPDDDEFYEGEIKSFDHLKKRHRVVYTDGDEEHLNLRKEEWEFVTDDSALDGGKSAEHSGQGASSKKKKKKGANSKTSNKHEKMSNPPRRKLKGSASKSGSKSNKDGKAKFESPVNSEDGSDKSEDHSEEHEVKSPDSSAKSGRSQPSLKKRAIQRLANSKGKSPQSEKTVGPVGKGTKKSSSSKAKVTVQEEKKVDSVKSADTVKGGKAARESGNKSGKKRRK
ncbi:hypothetical protein ACS0TY_022397 [Phlomoides rotata]